MRQKINFIIRILIQNLSWTKFVCFLYYNHIIRGALTAMPPRDGLKPPINGFINDHILTGFGGSSFFDGKTRVKEVSSVQAAKGIIFNLEKDFTLPAYNPPLKIMPLGDSITHGVRGINDRDSGGYRTELWHKFVSDGWQVEFVGSRSDGPDSLSSKNHQGCPAWTIAQIAASVNDWLNTYQPDIIMLMLGTNDTKKNSLKTMIYEFSDLIDQIAAQSPDAQLLVASIPPVHPTARSVISVLRAMYFNTAIPEIVNTKVAQGKKVDFVDMRSLTASDLTSSRSPSLDSGYHPNAQGYYKIAKFWYDAVLKVLAPDKLVKSLLATHYPSSITIHDA